MYVRRYMILLVMAIIELEVLVGAAATLAFVTVSSLVGLITLVNARLREGRPCQSISEVV